MNKKRPALGRGLSALIPAASPGPATQSSYHYVPIKDIAQDPKQPRQHFDPHALEGLVQSIKEQGILQPIILRRNELSDEPAYVIVAGERRWRAARAAGLKEVPVVIREDLSEDSLELALIENLQREDLNPIEEAEAYQRLLQQKGYTQDILARRLGKSRSAITNAIRLLQLEGSQQSALMNKEITAGHARALLSIPDRETRELLFQRILDKNLSVRAAEEWARHAEKDAEENDSPKPKGKPKAAHPLKPFYDNLATELSAFLNHEVRLETKGRKGSILIPFESLEELGQITASLRGETKS